jgi:hypothetical protein
VIILPGSGGFEVFTLTEDGGPGSAHGISASVVDAVRIAIVMSAPPVDAGNGWFWGIDSSGGAARVVAADGGAIETAGGDLVIV